LQTIVSLPLIVETPFSLPGLILTHIQELAQQLYTNENPNPQPYVQKILKPPDGAFARIHQPPLPRVNPETVQAIIDEGLAKSNLKVRLVKYSFKLRVTISVYSFGSNYEINKLATSVESGSDFSN
jgi:hypothetical protein